MHPKFETLLLALTKTSTTQRQNYNASQIDDNDPTDGLTDNQQKGLRRVLSSVATSEGYESIILTPIQKSFQSKVASQYLSEHSNDEDHHHQMITKYLYKNFNYTKKKLTTADKVIYEKLVPSLKPLLMKFPFLGIIALYTYEVFSVDLYDELKQFADKHQLRRLHEMIESIIRDEKRHIAGLETLMKSYKPNTFIEKSIYTTLTPMVLSVIRLDLNMGKWGFLNRDLIMHFDMLGIKASHVDEFSKNAVKKSKKIFIKLYFKNHDHKVLKTVMDS